jgi:hypothetical protein
VLFDNTFFLILWLVFTGALSNKNHSFSEKRIHSLNVSSSQMELQTHKQYRPVLSVTRCPQAKHGHRIYYSNELIHLFLTVVELFDCLNRFIGLLSLDPCPFLSLCNSQKPLCEGSLFILLLCPLYVGSNPSKQDCIKNESLLPLEIPPSALFPLTSCRVLMDPNYEIWILTEQPYILISTDPYTFPGNCCLVV